MPENRDNLVPYTYMPFGIGPRNCVGMRFALMEAKTAVVHLINKLKFVKSSNTQIPLKFKKFEFLLTAGDINVGVELRK
jgi:cytochrome P450